MPNSTPHRPRCMLSCVPDLLGGINNPLSTKNVGRRVVRTLRLQRVLHSLRRMRP